METFGFVLIALVILGFALISGRSDRLIITPPMVFAGFGLLVGAGGLGLVNLNVEEGTIHLLAELTLVLVLFTDAARIDFRRLSADHDLPIRMLAYGMPLTIIMGTLLAVPLFPEFSVWEAALLAAILTPTDAALGQSVVTSPRVPTRIRQALNVESGLNDGIALPVIVLFLCFANPEHQMDDGTNFLLFGILQVTLGPLAGAVIGYLGGQAIERSSLADWMSESFQGVSALALALLAFAGAEAIGGNGFIAAFVAGLTMGNTTHHCNRFVLDFAEAEGQLLTLFVFMVFGAVLVPDLFAHLTWQMVAYAVLALTVMRMVPVAISMIGAKLLPGTVLFLGWFGPRGLASILFALLVVEETMGNAVAEQIIMLTILTVALSIIAHGVTAAPFANWYGRSTAARHDSHALEEMRDTHAIPTRFGRVHKGDQT